MDAWIFWARDLIWTRGLSDDNEICIIVNDTSTRGIS